MLDPVQQKLANRMWNEAITIASQEVQIEALSAEIARLQAEAPEATPSPEGDVPEAASSPEGDED